MMRLDRVPSKHRLSTSKATEAEMSRRWVIRLGGVVHWLRKWQTQMAQPNRGGGIWDLVGRFVNHSARVTGTPKAEPFVHRTFGKNSWNETEGTSVLHIQSSRHWRVRVQCCIAFALILSVCSHFVGTSKNFVGHTTDQFAGTSKHFVGHTIDCVGFMLDLLGNMLTLLAACLICWS